MLRKTQGGLGVLILALAAATSLVAADASFTGTWKLNLAKSHLTGQTFTFSKTASGVIHCENQGFDYDFDLNGKEYPMPDGGTVAVKAPNAATWEFTFSEHGKVVETLRDSLDGDTLNWVTKLTKSDGTVVEQTASAKRVSGGPGILGKWRSTEVKGGPTNVVITTAGQNDITLTYPELQETCKGSFDGKDYPVTEAGAPSKMTFAFAKTGANTFKMTTKLNGKAYYTDIFTVSADGKTLTDDSNAVSVDEPTKLVFEKQ